MKKIIFHCEVITPMFLAGADGSTPEMRPPSIKAGLRFWWRALQGHILDLESLKAEETDLFGGINGRNGKKCPFQILVLKQPASANIGSNLKKEINPFKNKGIAYLLYSTFLNKRPYYLVGTEFSFEIRYKDDKIIQKLKNTLLSFSLFGALGTRSRRGAGNFIIKNIEGVNSSEFEGLRSHLLLENEDILKQRFSEYSNILNKVVHTKYSVLKNSEVFLFNSKSDWKHALSIIGDKFEIFRAKRRCDIWDTPNLGFPIRHRKDNLRMIGRNFDSEKKREDYNRRTSPLIFKVIKTQDNNFYPLILWLKGDLLPSGSKISEKNGTRSAIPDSSIVQDFLDELTKVVKPNYTHII